MITSTDLTGNCWKAWQTIRKISNDPTVSKPPCLVTANQVAHQLLVNGRGDMPTKPKCPKLSPISEDDSALLFPFTEEEYKKGMVTLKNKKAAGTCCCLPTPMSLASGGVRCSRLWSTSQFLCPSGQQCSHPGRVCPQIQE